MSICILVGKSIINIFNVYAPQTGLSVVEKDSFYSALLSNISTVSPDEYLLVGGDFNGHVGKAPEGLMEYMVDVDLVHVILMEQEFLIYVQLQI